MASTMLKYFGKPDAEQWTVLMQWNVTDRARLTRLEVSHYTRPADWRSHKHKHNTVVVISKRVYTSA